MVSLIDQLEHNQVVIREDLEGVKDKVDQMLEAMLASSEDNAQDATTDSTSGFTVMYNPMYDSPLHVDDCIQPQLVLNVLSNAIPTV